MKRQGLIVTLNQLQDLMKELKKEQGDVVWWNRKFQINIINKTPECSDTWELEL